MAEFIIGLFIGFAAGLVLGAWLEFREWTGNKERAWHAERLEVERRNRAHT